MGFFVRVVAMEKAVLVLAFVGKLRRHFLLLVVAMVLVLLLSSFASPLSDEGVCARLSPLRHPFLLILFPLLSPKRKTRVSLAFVHMGVCEDHVWLCWRVKNASLVVFMSFPREME